MPVATLSAGLLARKGDARPSIVNPTDPHPIRDAEPLAARGGPAGSLCGIGRLAPSESADAAADGVRRDRHGRARISLRLDPARHRRLRLASVHLDASIQDILTAALDAYLSGLDLHCPCVEQGHERCPAPAGRPEGAR